MKETNENRSDDVLNTVTDLPDLLVRIYNTMDVLGSIGILVIRYLFGHLINMASVVLDPEQIDDLLESACNT